jgi:hypothetical protein
MRDWLAFTYGRLFIFFFNRCALLNNDMAFGMLSVMYETSKRDAEMNSVRDNYHRCLREAEIKREFPNA